MSASYVALTVELPDLEELFPIIEIDSRSGRQAAFLAFINEQFDSEYEEDIEVEDIAIDGGRLIVEYQSSTELCNEITHALFEGLSEREGSGMLAMEYNSRIGVYSVMAPGYDEAEYVDECFDDFDGMMHELEEFMDRRDQLLRMVELAETDPVKSRLREYLDEEEEEMEEPAEEEGADEENGDDSSKPSLMDELHQALADGDEERAAELFAQVQKQG